MPDRDKDRIALCIKVYGALSILALEETKCWGFSQWYQDGIDWYLAREVVYLATEWLDDDDYNREIREKLKEYTPEELARGAYEYAASIDDFPRLWQGDDAKREIIREYLEELDYQRSKNEKDTKGAKDAKNSDGESGSD